MKNPQLMETLDDHALMAQTQQGSKHAFEILIHRYQHYLLNFFLGMNASIEDAEDLVQDTLLRLFKYRKQYRPMGKFTTFLYRLAYHAWIDKLRKRKRWLQVVDAVCLDVAIEHKETEHMDNKMDMEHALRQLSDKLRSVVVLSIFQGFRYKEIGYILEIPECTVRTRMHHAVKQLKKILSVSAHAS